MFFLCFLIWSWLKTKCPPGDHRLLIYFPLTNTTFGVVLVLCLSHSHMAPYSPLPKAPKALRPEPESPVKSPQSNDSKGLLKSTAKDFLGFPESLSFGNSKSLPFGHPFGKSSSSTQARHSPPSRLLPAAAGHRFSMALTKKTTPLVQGITLRLAEAKVPEEMLGARPQKNR